MLSQCYSISILVCEIQIIYDFVFHTSLVSKPFVGECMLTFIESVSLNMFVSLHLVFICIAGSHKIFFWFMQLRKENVLKKVSRLLLLVVQELIVMEAHL